MSTIQIHQYSACVEAGFGGGGWEGNVTSNSLCNHLKPSRDTFIKTRVKHSHHH